MTSRSVARALLAAALLLALAAAGAAAADARALPAGVDLRHADRCEFIAGGHCLLPFPSDRFTVRDRRTATGRRVAFDRASMPANSAGVRIDPAQWNRGDGFSPGQTIVVQVPGLGRGEALRRTGAVTLADLSAYARPDQAVVLLDARSGRRQPIWTELDPHAAAGSGRALLIHPARNLRPGGRYVVALRGLRDASGRPLRAPAGFRLYRDGIATGVAAVERRRAHFRGLFRTLARAGLARRSLYLTWDFTVASQRSLSARMLRIRDDAFGQLGDRDLADLRVAGRPPRHEITRVTDYSPAENAEIAREVEGTLEVPCYLADAGCPPGSTFSYAGSGPDALPRQLPGNVMRVPFLCEIPRGSGVAGGTVRALRPALYGHGSYGTEREVRERYVTTMAREHGFLFCAAPLAGFAAEDAAVSDATSRDFSTFARFTDRIQQGLLNNLLLGRLMIHPRGLAADRAFRAPGGQSLIDTTRLFYDGNSIGGVLGGALTAYAPDFQRAVLGVGAMDHSAMLPHSADWQSFAAAFAPAYPSRLARPLVLSLAQMLWDRAEPNGVASRMTDHPLPNTPRHVVLMQAGLGDTQVPNALTAAEARTIGAAVHAPIAGPGRQHAAAPFWGIPQIPVFPWSGSALTVWDNGPVDRGRAPPDPHGLVRYTPAAQEQKARFLAVDGTVVDTCGAGACDVIGWDG